MDLYKTPNRNYRPEIEGIRALAAILVAVYHIWLGNVSGGVDVFFVVSGFLIITSLVKSYEKKGKIDFIGFWVNLTNRLFPLAFTVLFTVIIVCLFILPETRLNSTILDVFASALYFGNWKLAYDSVDYLAQHNEASPLQHFWAMSVQGQFYIIFPILFFISLFIFKNKKSVRQGFLITLIAVFILSLLYSVYMTNLNQPWAYFDTFTRMWEFSLGGILALLINNIRLNKVMSFFAGWLGVIGLISCGIVLQVSTVFPGYAALYPTLSAVLILIAGNQGGSFGVHGILGSKLFVKLGSLSYGIYLWHWPLLIFYLIVSGSEKVSFLNGMVIILISILLSHLTTRYIETPIREYPYYGNMQVAKTSFFIFATVLLITFLWQGDNNFKQKHQAQVTNLIASNPASASTIMKNEMNVTFVPSTAQAKQDLPKMYKDGCHQNQNDAKVIECEYGNTKDFTSTIALVGGSHSAHWLPALEEVAKDEKIRILSYTKSACRFTTTAKDSCKKWNEDVIKMLVDKKPNLVFTTADTGQNQQPTVPQGFLEAWKQLDSKGLDVFAVRDNPWFNVDIPACVEKYGVDSKECWIERNKAVPAESPWSKLSTPPANVYYTDLTNEFCEKDYCKPTVNNILVYSDQSHITATFSRSLGLSLKKELIPLLN